MKLEDHDPNYKAIMEQLNKEAIAWETIVRIIAITALVLFAVIYCTGCESTVVHERPDGSTTLVHNSILEDTDGESREFTSGRGAKYKESKIGKDQTNVALAGVAGASMVGMMKQSNVVPLSEEQTARQGIKSGASVEKAKINADLQKSLAP